MLHNFLLKKERAKLRELELTRARTSVIIKAEQLALQKETIRGLGTGEGILFSFVAGCVTSLTVRHGTKALNLRHFPLSKVLTVVSLVAQLKGAD